jgi:hypothetical protein
MPENHVSSLIFLAMKYRSLPFRCLHHHPHRQWKGRDYWHHIWLNGEAPRNLTPYIFELARRKNRTMKLEIANDNWIRALRER